MYFWVVKDLKNRFLPAVLGILILFVLTLNLYGFFILMLICSAGLFLEMKRISVFFNDSYGLLHSLIGGASFLYVLYILLHYTWPSIFSNVAITPLTPWTPYVYLLLLLFLLLKKDIRTTLPIVHALYPIIGVLCVIQICFMDGHYEILPLLFLLFNVWMADAFAYFGGSLIKGPKLAVNISPNKTISGWISALVGVILISILINLNYWEWSWMKLCTWTVSIWFFATMGDLFESKIKRTAGIKDSGKFLPGHGGFLDRLDSLIYAAPVALYIYQF